jgi:methyl-accepting chemotaxis protein
MVKSLNNIPIFYRVFIAFAVVTIIPGTLIVLLGTYYLNAIQARDVAVHTTFEAQTTAYQQQASLQRMNAFLQAYMAQVFANGNVGDPSMSASAQLIGREIADREVTFGLTLTTYQQDYLVATSEHMQGLRNILLSDNPQTTIIQQQQQTFNTVIQQQWPAYQQLQDQELAILQNLQNPTIQHPPINQAYTQAYTVLFKADEAFLDLNNSWQSLVAIAQTMGEDVTTVGPSQTNPILIATAIALLCTVFVVVAIGTLINFTITQPLRDLTLLTRHIARGDTNARAKLLGRDEIALVASSMNTMLDNIVLLIQEAQSRHDILHAQVEKLMTEVSGVGEGNLRVQAEVTMGDLGVLADCFNYMVEELNNLIVHVKGVAREVRSSTLQTSRRMTQLVQTADVQIQQIAGAATEVEHMANSSRHVAERAEQLYKVAREARQTAYSGREAVHHTVVGIGHIQQTVQTTTQKVLALDERSKEIDDIVVGISAIANQTNRLALDASVQAAMAGENGKAFGAIAADIRRLAEQAKQQLSIIERVVGGFQEDISTVTAAMQEATRETTVDSKLAQEAGSALESIFTVIEHQADEMEGISRVSIQQLQSSGAVVQVIQQVTASTQQSSASTRETAGQMEHLAQLADRLLASVEAFKLRDDSQGQSRRPANGTTVTPVYGPEATPRNPFPPINTPTSNLAWIGNSTNGAINGSSLQPSFAPAQLPFPGQSNGNGTRGATPQPPASQPWGLRERARRQKLQNQKTLPEQAPDWGMSSREWTPRPNDNEDSEFYQ